MFLLSLQTVYKEQIHTKKNKANKQNQQQNLIKT